jgi:hypothetical protein
MLVCSVIVQILLPLCSLWKLKDDLDEQVLGNRPDHADVDGFPHKCIFCVGFLGLLRAVDLDEISLTVAHWTNRKVRAAAQTAYTMPARSRYTVDLPLVA